MDPPDAASKSLIWKIMSDDFYRAFEAKFRGSREVIKERLRIYAPFLKPLQSLYPNGESLDLGCGRGEWLELMDELGFFAVGVDLNQAMLDCCLDFRLRGLQADALEYLANLSDNSQVVISAFHLIEHIPFEKVHELVKQSLRVLKPGGLLILETPNAENIRVATQYFYLDPTHLKPIPSQQLSFLTEYVGFKRNKIIGLQEEVFSEPNSDLLVRKFINGVSQDYAIIAQKEIAHEIYGYSSNPFLNSYGIGIEQAIREYDDAVNHKITTLEAELKRLQFANSYAASIKQVIQENDNVVNHKITALETELKCLQDEFLALFSSRSWRIAKSLRCIEAGMDYLKIGFYKALFFTRSKIKVGVWKFINKVKSYPRVYSAIKKVMNAFGIFNLLRLLAGYEHKSINNLTQLSVPWVPNSHLSERAFGILEEIKTKLNREIKN